MGDHWFDDLARSAAAPVSRREAMRRMGAGVAGVMLATVLPRRAWAGSGPSTTGLPVCGKRVCTSSDQGVKGGVKCGSVCCPSDANKANNYFCCPDGCKRLGSDPNNCGECGNACGPNVPCYNGVCGQATGVCGSNNANRIVCPPPPVTGGTVCCDRGDLCCGDVCTDVSKDQNHCGDCDTACGLTERCVDGQCCACPERRICQGECCPPKAHCESGVFCVCDSNNEPPCDDGTCCPAGKTCCGGRCVTCPTGFGCCNGFCTDLKNNRAHCGSCDGPASNCDIVCGPSLGTCCGGSCCCTLVCFDGHCGGTGT